MEIRISVLLIFLPTSKRTEGNKGKKMCSGVFFREEGGDRSRREGARGRVKRNFFKQVKNKQAEGIRQLTRRCLLASIENS